MSLLSQPQRTAAERAFLQRQRGICQQSLSGSSRASLTEASTVTDAPTPVAATSDSADCGPRALLLVCQEAHLPASLPELRRVAGVTAPRGASLEGLSKAAASVGFVPQAVQMDRDALANLSTPALAWVDGNHYIVVFEVKRSLRGIDYDTVFVRDPNKPEKETILLTDLLSRSGGVLLTLPRQLPRQKKQ